MFGFVRPVSLPYLSPYIRTVNDPFRPKNLPPLFPSGRPWTLIHCFVTSDQTAVFV